MSLATELQRTTLARHLRQHLQGEIRFDATSRKLYSTDASIYQMEPLGVVIPATVHDIVATVQIATEMQLPLTMRGGGTSLSGQSIGPGIILDCSKRLNVIRAIDPVARRAWVQPGVVLDQLNRALAPHGLHFGPDVATASRANLGGMIGNNSAGARSIVYGKTIDHVKRLSVVSIDGSQAEYSSLSLEEWDRRANLRTREGALYRETRQIVRESADEIHRRFPAILRRVSGYNLDVLCDLLFPERVPAPLFQAEKRGQAYETALPGLHQLIVGSEGTLAIVTEAELNLVPLPRSRGLLVLHFDSLTSALDALSACLEFHPSAVELLDGLLIEMARGNLSLRETMTAIQGRPAALLMVEFSSDSAADIADRAQRLEQRLRSVSGITAVVQALDPPRRDALWNLRRSAMPLLYGIRGDRKPITFVEDTAVAPERLPEFIARFRDVLHRHGTDGAFYGHASVGCLHIRPLLNLKNQADIDRMRRIAEDITDLVLEFHGSLSGEHGDGLARSEWNRKMFGPVVYGAFCRMKHLFDPHHLLNPGKIVAPESMTQHLRYGQDYHPTEPTTLFDYRQQEGFVRAIELCNGSGVCRKLEGGTMCPSFRATRDERDSTRGRANALRLALAGQQPLKDLRSRWVYEVLDLCLMCKACKSECPSNVDMAKLKAEFLQFYYKNRGRPLGQQLLAHVQRWNRLGAWAAPLVNWLQLRPSLRWLLEKTAGIDRRRSLPVLHTEHFRRWFARHKGEIRSAAGTTPRVLLLDDCFTTFYEPMIGQAAVRVLEAAGYEVQLASLTCCGRPLISKGFLREARDLVQFQLPRLARRLANGTPLLGLEPSCLLTLADEWPELVPGVEAQRVAGAAHLTDPWLAEQIQAGRCTLQLQPRPDQCLLHSHCHQKALLGPEQAAGALRLIPELEVRVLDAGCCGMAGSFGFEVEHYDLSVQIAGLALLPTLAAEPEALIAATGTSCRHQIKDLTARRAFHPLEILAEQISTSPAHR